MLFKKKEKKTRGDNKATRGRLFEVTSDVSEL